MASSPSSPGQDHSHLSALDVSTAAGVRALRIGVIGLGLTAAAQAGLLLLSGSVALLGDTLHNGVDVAGTALVWVAFALSRRQRSPGFGYGFHRFEDLAGLAVVLLIAGSAVLVLYESLVALDEPGDLSRPWLVVAAGLAGFLGNEGVAQYKLRTGRRIGSAALTADGQHSRADGLTSLGVVAAGFGILLDQPRLDAAMGLLIGLFIARAAYLSGRDVLLKLSDHAEPELRQRLERTACAIAGLDHLNDLRVRHAGRTVHVVAHVCMPASYDLGQAHAVAENLRLEWLQVLPPGSIVDVHADPYDPGRGSPHGHEVAPLP